MSIENQPTASRIFLEKRIDPQNNPGIQEFKELTLKNPTQLMLIDENAITWAYRLFLDREPESEAAITCREGLFQYTSQLRNHFLGSEEFAGRNGTPLKRSYIGRKPKLDIEVDVPEELLHKLFDRVESVWRTFGETEPYWSVMSTDAFRTQQITANLEEFYHSGRSDAETIPLTLERNGLELEPASHCTEIGCGVGRVTRWLSGIFQSVDAYDVSTPHLQLARQQLSETGKTNVALHQFKSIKDYNQLPKTDFVFSQIVLQHSPPPIIAYVIKALLTALRPGGFALFQVPTYLDNYSFDSAVYLDSPSDHETIEMHIIPQRTVFEIAEACSCRIIEVAEDHCIGTPLGGISNTFLIQKK